MEQKKSAAKLAQATAPPPTRHQQEIATGVLNMVQLQEFVLHVQGKLLVPVNAAELKRSAKVLRPVNFEDVVAERANEKLCGFPCCAEKLSSQKAAKYRISMSQRKVFDASEGVKYCSDQCMMAAELFKASLSDEPLHIRPIALALTQSVPAAKAAPSDAKAASAAAVASAPAPSSKALVATSATAKGLAARPGAGAVTADSAQQSKPEQQQQQERPITGHVVERLHNAIDGPLPFELLGAGQSDAVEGYRVRKPAAAAAAAAAGGDADKKQRKSVKSLRGQDKSPASSASATAASVEFASEALGFDVRALLAESSAQLAAAAPATASSRSGGDRTRASGAGAGAGVQSVAPQQPLLPHVDGAPVVAKQRKPAPAPAPGGAADSAGVSESKAASGSKSKVDADADPEPLEMFFPTLDDPALNDGDVRRIGFDAGSGSSPPVRQLSRAELAALSEEEMLDHLAMVAMEEKRRLTAGAAMNQLGYSATIPVDAPAAAKPKQPQRRPKRPASSGSSGASAGGASAGAGVGAGPGAAGSDRKGETKKSAPLASVPLADEPIQSKPKRFSESAYRAQLSPYALVLSSLVHWCCDATRAFILSKPMPRPLPIDPSTVATVQQRQAALFSLVLKHVPLIYEKLHIGVRVHRQLSDLICTFNLNEAIPTFRPEQWLLVAIVLLKSVAERETELSKQRLAKKQQRQQQQQPQQGGAGGSSADAKSQTAASAAAESADDSAPWFPSDSDASLAALLQSAGFAVDHLRNALDAMTMG